MFLGLQGDYIVTVSDNRQELENIREIAGFSSIEETNEPVERIDGQYIVGAENINNVMSNLRKEMYSSMIDPLHAEKQRKVVLGTWTEEMEAEYVAKVKELTEQIQTENPYIETVD